MTEQQQITTNKDPYCKCGHRFTNHCEKLGQCDVIIEGKNCEDHWRCPCKEFEILYYNKRMR